jgi:hypothetical protein
MRTNVGRLIISNAKCGRAEFHESRSAAASISRENVGAAESILAEGGAESEQSHVAFPAPYSSLGDTARISARKPVSEPYGLDVSWAAIEDMVAEFARLMDEDSGACFIHAYNILQEFSELARDGDMTDEQYQWAETMVMDMLRAGAGSPVVSPRGIY